MTDTPETKAFKTRIRGIDGDKHWVPALFAERLERERDEARGQNAKLRDIAERAIDDLAWFYETKADGPRAELERLKEGGE